jgi:hypothetical protein
MQTLYFSLVITLTQARTRTWKKNGTQFGEGLLSGHRPIPAATKKIIVGKDRGMPKYFMVVTRVLVLACLVLSAHVQNLYSGLRPCYINAMKRSFSQK